MCSGRPPESLSATSGDHTALFCLNRFLTRETHALSASQPSLCVYDFPGIWLHTILTQQIWALHSNAPPGAAVTAGTHRPHFEWQGFRQDAVGNLRLALTEFSFSPKRPPSPAVTSAGLPPAHGLFQSLSPLRPAFARFLNRPAFSRCHMARESSRSADSRKMW